jgi:DNA-binding XRE family transcriptional regulator
MKNLRSIPRILKINAVDGYLVSLLFNNGESRIVDFEHVLKNVLKKSPGKLGYALLDNYSLFARISIIGTTVGWIEIGISSKDFSGETAFHPYEIDPLILFNHSELDVLRNPSMGLKIRSARIAAGLTQEELAKRSGTSKHYISRLENNKSDIELLTLKKIIEAGLNKNLRIEIA